MNTPTGSFAPMPANAGEQGRSGLTGNALKLIAILAMTVDHLTWTLLPGYDTSALALCLHAVGRLTAPIMCYFVAEGYHYTHDRRRYALRLLLLALVSHFAYNFCFGIPFVPFTTSVFNQTGVVWALFWGMIALWIMDSRSEKLKGWMRYALVFLICLVSFCADWSCIAVLVIVAFGLNRGRFRVQMLSLMAFTAIYAAVYFFFIDQAYGVLQLAVALSIPLLRLYNGRRGQWRGMKWLFYVYYPLHLALCGLLRLALR